MTEICSFCNTPIKDGETSIAMDPLVSTSRMHIFCGMRSEAGEFPDSGNSSEGMLQMFEGGSTTEVIRGNVPANNWLNYRDSDDD